MGLAGAAHGRLLTSACGIALLALSFAPLWATYRVPGLGLFTPETRRLNAWDAYGLGMEVALVLTVVAVALTVVGGATGHGGARRAGIAFGVCVAATLALLWETVTGPEGSLDPNGYGSARGVFLFVGTGLACAMTYGGYLAMQAAQPDRHVETADRGE